MASQNYNINKKNTLIDLNGELVNFTAQYNIKSTTNKPFYYSIIDETSLEASDPQFMESSPEGIVSGNFTYNEDNHKVFYLILKNKEATNNSCDVSLNVTPVNSKAEIQKVQEQYNNHLENKKKEGGLSTLQIILIIAVACIASYFIYTSFIQKKPAKKITESPFVERNNDPQATPRELKPPSNNFFNNKSRPLPSPSVKFSERLKKLNVS